MYTDASAFLRQHPWPGRPPSEMEEAEHKSRRRNRIGRRLRSLCGRAEDVDSDDEIDSARDLEAGQEADERSREFRWTPELMQDFREELEKLVIFDYIIRNTDRGRNFSLLPCALRDVANVL
jgi:phosphatidylinositol 4-kinase type 2